MSTLGKRQRKWFRAPDSLEVRVFLLMLGGAFIAIGVLVASRSLLESSWIGASVSGVFVLSGAFIGGVGVFGGSKRVEKFGDAAGSHEAALVLFALAFILAWVLRKLFPRLRN